MLNRCVLTVKAKQPFVRWLRSLPDPCDILLAEVNSGTTAYLLPEYEDDNEQDVILAQYCNMIFEEQLAGWWKAETDWPKQRDIETLKKWFDVESHSLVFDLVDGPLQKEE